MSDFDIVREVLTWDSEARRHWDDDPFSALDRIESQNQALQERAERFEKALRDLGHGNHDHGLPPSVTCPACDALSPTQETDPE